MIETLIDNILDRRLGRNDYEGKGRLQAVLSQKEHLKELKKRVDNFDVVLKRAKSEIELKKGNFYAMSKTDPLVESNIRLIETESLQSAINAQITKLDLMENRFSRQAIQVALVGYERSGKSTCIQHITGLSNKVIPAYSGTSCTGAVSVIHNEDGPFHVEIEYYSEKEFIGLINAKYHTLFPKSDFQIKVLDDLDQIDFSSFQSNDLALKVEAIHFQKAFVDHREEYKSLLGKGVQSYSDENMVIQHVAQYEYFDDMPNGANEKECELCEVNGRMKYKLNYYKYVAVKSVNIYTRFSYEDCGKLILVDTIGLGPTIGADEIEKEMFRVLCEDCDAAIDVWRPHSSDSLNQTQINILEKISTELRGRKPNDWIVYVLNKVETGEDINVGIIGQLLQDVNKLFSDKEKSPVAWAKAINFYDREAVISQLLEPLLNLIVEKLDAIDKNLMEQVNQDADRLYLDYKDLCDAAEQVISNTLKHDTNIGKKFDELYDSLDLLHKLQEIDEYGYGKTRHEPCLEISNRIDTAANSLAKFIPSLDEIVKMLEKGFGRSSNGDYEVLVNSFRNDVYAEFERINTEVLLPLQEKVKADLIMVLYNSGLWSHISSVDSSQSNQWQDIVSLSKENLAVDWLRHLMDDKVGKDIYPKLWGTLCFILDYRLSIEGLMEFNVDNSVACIDPKRPREFIQMEPYFSETLQGRAKELRQELMNRIDRIQESIYDWKNNFALIPSHSFSTRVKKFREKILDIRETELREFYRDNMGEIWAEEIMNIKQNEKDFGEWNGVLCQLRIYRNNKESFKISIS